MRVRAGEVFCVHREFFNLHILANGFFFCVENDCFCLDKRMMRTTLKVSISFHGRKAHKKHKIINQYLYA